MGIKYLNDRKQMVAQVVYKKMTVDSTTRSLIESVKIYLPDNLQTGWEFDCYYSLAVETLSNKSVKMIAKLLSILFENRTKEEIKGFIDYFILSLDDDIETCNSLLRKYAPRQDILGMLLYSRFSGIQSEDFDAEEEFKKFYGYAKNESTWGSFSVL